MKRRCRWRDWCGRPGLRRARSVRRRELRAAAGRADPHPIAPKLPATRTMRVGRRRRSYSGPAATVQRLRRVRDALTSETDQIRRPDAARLTGAGAAPQSDDEYQDDEQRQDEPTRRPTRRTTMTRMPVPRRAAVAWSLIMAVLGLVVIGVASAFGYAPCSAARSCRRCRRSSKRATVQTRSCRLRRVATPKLNADASNSSPARSWSRAKSSRSIPAAKIRRRASSPLFRSSPARMRPPVCRVRRAGASAPMPGLRRVPTPLSAACGCHASASACRAAPSAPPEPKKIHTVTIRADQPAAPMPRSAPAAPPRGLSARSRPAEACSGARRAAPPPANAPLSIVPVAEGHAVAAPPAPHRTRAQRAGAQPPRSPSDAGCRSAVQRRLCGAGHLAAQRGRCPGRRSSRYRPNSPASSAAASRSSIAPISATRASIIAPWSAPLPRRSRPPGLCSSLKAAGGSCIVQRN